MKYTSHKTYVSKIGCILAGNFDKMVVHVSPSAWYCVSLSVYNCVVIVQSLLTAIPK